MNTPASLSPSIVRPKASRFIQMKMQSALMVPLLASLTSYLTILIIVPQRATEKPLVTELESLFIALSVTYLTGILSGLFYLSFVEYYEKPQDVEGHEIPIGYAVVIPETDQESLSFINQLRKMPISSSTLMSLWGGVQGLRQGKCRDAATLVQYMSFQHIDDLQLGDNANITTERYSLKDVSNCQDTGRYLGRFNSPLQGFLINYFLIAPTSNNGDKANVIAFALMLSSFVVGEYMTESVFSKSLTFYSALLGPRYKGRFFNVTVEQMRQVFDAGTNTNIETPLLQASHHV